MNSSNITNTSNIETPIDVYQLTHNLNIILNQHTEVQRLEIEYLRNQVKFLESKIEFLHDFYKTK